MGSFNWDGTGGAPEYRITQIVGDGVTWDFDEHPQMEIRVLGRTNLADQTQIIDEFPGSVWTPTEDTATRLAGAFTNAALQSTIGLDVTLDNEDESIFMKVGGLTDPPASNATSILYTAINFKMPDLSSGNWRMYNPHRCGAIVIDPQTNGVGWKLGDVDEVQFGWNYLGQTGSLPIPEGPSPLTPGTNFAGYMDDDSYTPFEGELPFVYLWNLDDNRGILFLFKDNATTGPHYRRFRWQLDGGRVLLQFQFWHPHTLEGIAGASNYDFISNNCGLEVKPMSANIFEAARHVGNRLRDWGHPDYTKDWSTDTSRGNLISRNMRFYISGNSGVPQGEFDFLDERVAELADYLETDNAKSIFVAVYTWWQTFQEGFWPGAPDVFTEIEQFVVRRESFDFTYMLYLLPFGVSPNATNESTYAPAYRRDAAQAVITVVEDSTTISLMHMMTQSVRELLSDELIQNALDADAVGAYMDAASYYYSASEETALSSAQKSLGSPAGIRGLYEFNKYTVETNPDLVFTTETKHEFLGGQYHFTGNSMANRDMYEQGILLQLPPATPGTAYDPVWNMFDVRQYCRPWNNRTVIYDGLPLGSAGTSANTQINAPDMAAVYAADFWHNNGVPSFLMTKGILEYTWPPESVRRDGTTDVQLWSSGVEPKLRIWKSAFFDIGWDRQIPYIYGYKLVPPANTHEWVFLQSGPQWLRDGSRDAPSTFKGPYPGPSHPKLYISVHEHPFKKEIVVRVTNWTDKTQSQTITLTAADHLASCNYTFDILRESSRKADYIARGLSRDDDLVLEVTAPARGCAAYYLEEPIG